MTLNEMRHKAMYAMEEIEEDTRQDIACAVIRGFSSMNEDYDEVGFREVSFLIRYAIEEILHHLGGDLSRADDRLLLALHSMAEAFSMVGSLKVRSSNPGQ